MHIISFFAFLSCCNYCNILALTPSLWWAAYAAFQTFYRLVTPMGTTTERGGKRADASKERNFVSKIECFFGVFCDKNMCQNMFPIFVAIKQALVSVFAYIYQAGKTLNLCCHGNRDKPEIWLKMNNFTPVFCGCDSPGKSHFLRSTHFLCCIKFSLVLASITWNLTLVAPLKLKLLAYEYQQVKITSKNGHFGDPLEGRELRLAFLHALWHVWHEFCWHVYARLW